MITTNEKTTKIENAVASYDAGHTADELIDMVIGGCATNEKEYKTYKKAFIAFLEENSKDIAREIVKHVDEGTEQIEIDLKPGECYTNTAFENGIEKGVELDIEKEMELLDAKMLYDSLVVTEYKDGFRAKIAGQKLYIVSNPEAKYKWQRETPAMWIMNRGVKVFLKGSARKVVLMKLLKYAELYKESNRISEYLLKYYSPKDVFSSEYIPESLILILEKVQPDLLEIKKEQEEQEKLYNEIFEKELAEIRRYCRHWTEEKIIESAIQETNEKLSRSKYYNPRNSDPINKLLLLKDKQSPAASNLAIYIRTFESRQKVWQNTYYKELKTQKTSRTPNSRTFQDADKVYMDKDKMFGDMYIQRKLDDLDEAIDVIDSTSDTYEEKLKLEELIRAAQAKLEQLN